MAALHDDEPERMVLVVGPDPDATGFIAAVLNRAGIASDAALTADAAAEVMSAEPPYSMVVLDTDLVALRSIRALADPHRAEVPTMVLGPLNAPAEAVTEAAQQGSTAWLDRPVDEDELIEGVRRMLGEPPNREAGDSTSG